jgi:HEAT repeat protein
MKHPFPFPAARRSRFAASALCCIVLACSFHAARAAEQAGPSGVALPEDAGRLIAVLRASEAPVAQKARACQQLAIVGQKDAVPALAALLSHPELSSYARDALEQMPDPEAGDALRRALGDVSGVRLAGVVNSLGVRGEAKSVKALAPLVLDSSKGVTAEALLAMGRIGSEEALKAVREALLSGSPQLRSSAAEACLLGAENAMRREKPEAAAALYDAVRGVDVDQPVRLAAIRGAILARREKGVPLLMENLASQETPFREVAMRVARELPGEGVSEALARELSAANASTRVLLLNALRDRGDEGVHEAIEPLAGAESGEVRVAALEALGEVGGRSSVPVLIRSVLRSGVPAEAEAAAESLARIRASNAERALLEALPNAPAEVRTRLIGILGQREAEDAAGALLREAEHADARVSRAAFEALPSVAGRGDLPEVIHVAIRSRDPAVREVAERAMYNVALKIPEAERRSDAFAEAFEKVADPEGRSSIMQVLAMLGDATAQKVIASGYESADPQVRDTALRLLTHWPDATPTPLLLRIFKNTSNEVHRTLALRGIVTLATLWAGDARESGRAASPPPREAIEWLTAANNAVRDVPEEKRIILSGLGDLNSAEGLRLLQPYVEDTDVRKEAALAAIRAAKGVTTPQDREIAQKLLEKVAEANSDAEIRQQAQAALKEIGDRK